MSKSYDPRQGIKNAVRAMNTYVKKHERPELITGEPKNLPDVGLASVAQEPAPCVVLLRSFTDGNRDIVPDDFFALRTAKDLQAHVRPDGAIYLGAYELQNTPDSLCMVYGPASMTSEKAERLATLERPALMRRHTQAQLGPFAAAPTPTAPTLSA